MSAEPGVSQAALALRLHRAPSGLSRRFRKDFGIGFVEYRSRIRVMRFIEAVDSGKSVVRAALDVEFGSYVQCHRVFRRALGCSPTDYFAGARTRSMPRRRSVESVRTAFGVERLVLNRAKLSIFRLKGYRCGAVQVAEPFRENQHAASFKLRLVDPPRTHWPGRPGVFR